MKLLATLLVLSVSLGANADFMPPNNLHLQDNVDSLAGITEAQFNEIIDGIEKVYAPIVSKHGGTLKVNRLWTNSLVNASAEQVGTSWIVNMYGGLARRPEVTADGFALVVCHELGHHLAGFSFKGERWAANEGQSDYFATQACARHIWKSDVVGNEAAAEGVDPFARAQCLKTWNSRAQQNLCFRIASGGHSLATLLGGAGAKPVFDKPNPTVVKMTNDNHPQFQCRLDTFFQGALCESQFDVSVIPAKGLAGGQNTKAAETIANKYSCAGIASSTNVGARPACWFASKMGTTK